MERAKPIKLTNNETGKKYTIDFNRDVVRRAERNGFSPNDCERYPSKLADLWYYGFLMHHEREITRKVTDALLDDLGGIAGAPDGLFERLGELYWQTYKTLDDNEKNGQVTVAF